MLKLMSMLVCCIQLGFMYAQAQGVRQINKFSCHMTCIDRYLGSTLIIARVTDV